MSESRGPAARFICPVRGWSDSRVQSQRRIEGSQRELPAGVLGDRRGGGLRRQHGVELVSRADSQLGEDFVEVVLDRAPADEQPRGDLGVGDAVASQPRDVGLLSGEVLPRLDDAFANVLAGREELALGAAGERLSSYGHEDLVRDSKLLACVHASALAAKPLAIEKMGSSELYARACLGKPVDGLPIQVLRQLAVAD